MHRHCRLFIPTSYVDIIVVCIVFACVFGFLVAIMRSEDEPINRYINKSRKKRSLLSVIIF